MKGCLHAILPCQSRDILQILQSCQNVTRHGLPPSAGAVTDGALAGAVVGVSFVAGVSDPAGVPPCLSAGAAAGRKGALGTMAGTATGDFGVAAGTEPAVAVEAPTGRPLPGSAVEPGSDRLIPGSVSGTKPAPSFGPNALPGSGRLTTPSTPGNAERLPGNGNAKRFVGGRFDAVAFVEPETRVLPAVDLPPPQPHALFPPLADLATVPPPAPPQDPEQPPPDAPEPELQHPPAAQPHAPDLLVIASGRAPDAPAAPIC